MEDFECSTTSFLNTNVVWLTCSFVNYQSKNRNCSNDRYLGFHYLANCREGVTLRRAFLSREGSSFWNVRLRSDTTLKTSRVLRLCLQCPWEEDVTVILIWPVERVFFTFFDSSLDILTGSVKTKHQNGMWRNVSLV